MWAARAIHQTFNALRLKFSDPVVERPAANVKFLTCRVDTALVCYSNCSHPESNLIQVRPGAVHSRPTILSCQEEEARPLPGSGADEFGVEGRTACHRQSRACQHATGTVQYLSRNLS